MAASPTAATADVAGSRPAPTSYSGGIVDRVVFGDPDSEEAHAFRSDGSVLGDAEGTTTRTAQPLSPLQNRLGDLVVTVKVDSAAQNYLSMTYSGDEASALRTNLLVDGQYINYFAAGDYESINPGFGAGLPGRQYTATTLLPLEVTQGRSSVQITVRTAAAAATALAATSSRTYFDLTTHVEASATLIDESGRAALSGVSAADDWSDAEEQSSIDGYRAAQLARVAAIANKIDTSPSGIPDIQKYADELRYYAEALVSEWSPDTTDAQKRSALSRIFAVIDRYTIRYYGDVKSLGSGGHQSDWGGYYAELGEALYIVENVIADGDVLGREAFETFLAEPLVTGTVDGDNSIAGVDAQGGELSRFEAWERVMKANFDFARSRLSYISNQVHYNYEGAWRSHEGLRVIDSEYYEGRDRSHEILREIWGLSPYLGEEVLVGPDGQELDLSHGLFNHDDNVEYTDDFLDIVMRGLAQSKFDNDGNVVRREPYGTEYLSITDEALLRENHYVGSYGETANWIPTYFWRTWGHAGDEAINAELLRQALKNLHSRGLTRYQGVTASGDRAMFMEQIVDDRNTAYPGKTAYATETNANLGMLYVALEEHMAENAELYQGEEWDEYWEYAAEGVGFMQQQLADNQYFPYFASGTRAVAQMNKDHRVPESWAWLNGGREAALGEAGAGVVLPNTDLQLYSDEELAELGVARDALDERTAWVDIDNLLVRVRDGENTILGSLAMRNYGYLANGRLHVQSDGQEQMVQIATSGEFEYQETTVIADAVANPILVDPDSDGPRAGNARAGQVVPITYQPGVGTVDRDNFVVDNPYSGYPNLIRAVYGDYLFAVNTTREQYGNAERLDVALPAGVQASSVLDLVSGKTLTVRNGAVSVPSQTAVVLSIEDADRLPQAPQQVDAVALAGSDESVAVSWRLSPGATEYRVERASGGGKFKAVARGVTGSVYLDEKPGRDGTYRYRVVAVNGGSEAAASDPVQIRVDGKALSGDWEQTPVGDVGDPRYEVKGKQISISSAEGAGYGAGDDYNIYDRFSEDALAQITQSRAGSYTLSAELTEHSGDVAGLTVRGGTEATSPYVYLGATADGSLQLRVRTLDTRVNLIGSAGTVTGKRTDQTSPRTIALDGYNGSDYPHLRLDRDASGQRVIAYVSADGRAWVRVGQIALWTSGASQAGVVATESVAAVGVRVTSIDGEDVVAGLRQDEQQVQLVWTRPETASAFRVYATTDARTARKDPRRSDGWEAVADGITDTGISTTLVGANGWYVIAALDEFGAVTSVSDPVSAAGYPLADLIAQARALDLTGYTAPSGAAFLDEVAAVEAAAAEEGADHAALARRLADAYGLLVQLYIDGFESETANRWSGVQASGTPSTYTQTIDDDADAAHAGSGSLLIANAGTEKSASHNMWFTNGASTVPVDAAPETTYRISFAYQLTDYSYASSVGAYLFVRGYSGSTAPEAEKRFWLQQSDTAEGEWDSFSTLLTTSSQEIDHFVLQLGLRGATGSFRVDDLHVEPVDLLDALIADARATDLSGYTEASVAAFLAEVDAIAAAAAAAAPEADRTALVARLEAAKGVLVQVFVEDFGSGAAVRWSSARASGTPSTYAATLDGEALVLSSVDATLSTAHNVWFTNATSTIPVSAAPSSTYRISLRYQLTEYAYTPNVGAYLFTRGFSGSTGGAETRFWLREAATGPGEWRSFETELTTSSAAIDRLVLQFGLRGSSGMFRVDDVRIEPVG
ncbi:hypothetical protein [Microbacterium sp. NPDC056234]|uniref:hypothetical protein n=1 Tax=Microbacterium sp. NPDC056234 TaxID=3345757 RepID=UPI0035E33CCD